MNDNKVYKTIFTKLLHDIRNNKRLTNEHIDFIDSLPGDKKMEIILIYNEVTQLNRKLLDELLDTTSLK